MTDPAALAAWLVELRPLPLEQRFEALHACMLELADVTLGPDLRAALMEQLRNVLPGDVARIASGFYANRPLPLAEPERAMLERVHAAYAALEAQYWLCVEGYALQTPSEQVKQNMAGAVQRAIHTIVSRMIEDYRARQVLDAALWDRLNRLLDQAHAHGLGRHGVTDELNPNQASSIDSTYGRAILLAAAQAGAMTPRNLDATLAMTALLEPFIDCSWQPAAITDSPEGLTRTGRLRVLHTTGRTHLLNNARLASALQGMATRLAAGEPIASLDVLPIARSELSGLLTRLHRVWCGAGEIRAAVREPTDERVAIASGAQAIFALLSGAEFAVPRQFHVYEGSGRPGEGAATIQSTLAGSGDSGTWQVLDRNVEGLRARRSLEGGRLLRGYLIGIHEDPDKQLVEFALGEIRWVQEQRGTGLYAGIKLLPGKARAVAARLFGGTDGNQYQQIAPVFLLEQGAAPKLVVPKGWWRPERVIDIHKDGAYPRLRMGELLMQGTDFEIGRFVVVKR
jgi:hypothetical protein